MNWLTALKAGVALSVWACIHSLLATNRVKELARARLGERRANALYRAGYNAFALLLFGAVLRYVWSLPDRRLYSVGGRQRAAMIGGQVLCGLAILDGFRRVGVRAFAGVGPLIDLVTGRPISPSPVAQHPLPKGEGELEWGGPYRLSRHPLNYFVLVAYWLSPVMTVKWAAFGAVTALYMVLGSRHEESRLLRAYGDRYGRYRERVAHGLLLPGRPRARRSP